MVGIKKNIALSVLAISVVGGVGFAIFNMFMHPPEYTRSISATPSTPSPETSSDTATETPPAQDNQKEERALQDTTVEDTPTPTTTPPQNNIDYEAIRKAQEEQQKAINEAYVRQQQEQAALLEAQRITRSRQSYVSGRNTELQNNQRRYNKAKSSCESQYNVAWSNQYANCMVRSYGGSVGDYYPSRTDNAFNQNVAAINTKYNSLCAAIGGC